MFEKVGRVDFCNEQQRKNKRVIVLLCFALTSFIFYLFLFIRTEREFTKQIMLYATLYITILGLFFSISRILKMQKYIIFLHYVVIKFRDIIQKYEYKNPEIEYSTELNCILMMENESQEVPSFIRKIENTKDLPKTIQRAEAAEQALASALQQVEELKQVLASAHDTHSKNIEGNGLCSLVIRMRQEGKTNEKIAEFLDSSGCSLSQIGALLHTDPEATQAAQMKLAQRLLGKA